MALQIPRTSRRVGIRQIPTTPMKMTSGVVRAGPTLAGTMHTKLPVLPQIPSLTPPAATGSTSAVMPPRGAMPKIPKMIPKPAGGAAKPGYFGKGMAF